MPEMSGPDLAAQLKAQRPDINVLYMSGYAGRLLSHHGVLEAEAALLPKPLTKHNLLARVGRFAAAGCLSVRKTCLLLQRGEGSLFLPLQAELVTNAKSEFRSLCRSVIQEAAKSVRVDLDPNLRGQFFLNVPNLILRFPRIWDVEQRMAMEQ
jgi:DNA-binding NarL/FixJ family response regulator